MGATSDDNSLPDAGRVRSAGRGVRGVQVVGHMRIDLPCGAVIETDIDITSTLYGGSHEIRDRQAAERVRIIGIMTALGYTPKRISDLSRIPHKAVHRLMHRRRMMPARVTGQRTTAAPSSDPVVVAFWERWDKKTVAREPAQ